MTVVTWARWLMRTALLFLIVGFVIGVAYSLWLFAALDAVLAVMLWTRFRANTTGQALFGPLTSPWSISALLIAWAVVEIIVASGLTANLLIVLLTAALYHGTRIAKSRS
jgi:hypothetical protein